MQEILHKIKLLVWGFWRFRWTALLVAWLVSLVGWAFVERLDYKYTATARIFVDNNQVLEPLLKGITVQPDVEQQVALMSRALLTRPNLEKLMLMTDMDDAATNDAEIEAILNGLKREVKLGSGRRNRSLYTVRYDNTDPDLAKRVVQSLITIFIESNLGGGREDTASAQSFLDNQIADYERRLIDAEQRLKDFRRVNAGVMPSESGGFYTRLQTANSQLRAARVELSEARNRRSELARQIAQETPVILQNSSGGGSLLESRIQEMQNELNALSVRYTDRHPRVAQLRDTIADLREEQRTSAPQQPTTSRASSLQASPIYQAMRASLSEAEARVAELQARVSDYDREVINIQATVDNIPEVEAQLKQLDRDYETVQRQHATLLERRESARLSEQLDQSDDLKFRVIDPPFVPSKPTSPNKQLMNLGVLLAGLGIGAGLTFLLSQLRPTYYDQKNLYASTGLPVFGSVSMIQNRMSAIPSAIGTAGFVSLVGLLVLVCGGLLFISMKGMSLTDVAGTGVLDPILKLGSSAAIQDVLTSDVVVRATAMVQGN